MMNELRKIDADRMMAVSFYVDDSVRGVENVGLTELEAEALRLVAAYERENGRQPGSADDGYVRAASRLLDNAFVADDGPHESAKFMAADLATQRFSASVVAAAEAFGKDGTEPVGFDAALVKYVIKSDLQEDDEIKADWKAMAEGRFEDASEMSHEIIDHAVSRSEHLPEGAAAWMYENQIEEEMPERDRRSNLVDVLDMMDEQLPYEPSSRDFEEWKAGEPDAYDWDDERHKAESDRFFGREPSEDRQALSHQDVVSQRVAEAREESLRPQHVVDEVERLGKEGYSFHDKSVYVAGDRLRIMLDANDDRAPALASALAHAVMSDRGGSASESAAWMFEERPAGTLSDALNTIDKEDGDLKHGLSQGVSMRIAMSQAKDDVRGLTSDDRSVDGMVAASQLAAEERGVPVKRLMAAVAEERRRSNPTFAANSEVVNDAVRDTYAEMSVSNEIERRARESTQVRRELDAPFFEHPTDERLDRASNAIRDLDDAVRRDDWTIAVEPGLRLVHQTLDAAGFDMDESRNVDRLEAAWSRVIEQREFHPSLTAEQEARMTIYDVCTQAEAAGLSSGSERVLKEATTGRVLVSTMGIRTIAQEQAGPMPLTAKDLGSVAAGNFHDLSRGTQAGLSLGTSWAKDSEKLPLRDVQPVRAPKGLMGQAASVAASHFSRVGSKAPREVDASSVVLGAGRSASR